MKVLSGRLRRLITVALTDLRPAPPSALAPGELTDTWAVMDQHGTWLWIVEGTTYRVARSAARRAAARAPQTRSRSLHGIDFLYRRLRSSEIAAELHAAAVPSA